MNINNLCYRIKGIKELIEHSDINPKVQKDVLFMVDELLDDICEE